MLFIAQKKPPSRMPLIGSFVVRFIFDVAQADVCILVTPSLHEGIVGHRGQHHLAYKKVPAISLFW